MNEKRKAAFEEWNKGSDINDENLAQVIKDMTMVCEVFSLIAKGPTLVGLYIMLSSMVRMQEMRR